MGATIVSLPQPPVLPSCPSCTAACEGFVRHSIKTECQSEVLRQPSFLKSCTEPDMMFSAPGDATTVLQQKVPCHGQGSGNSYCGGGGGPHQLCRLSCLEPIESFECELESGARVRGEVTERGRGQYEIRPVTKGRNLLHIRVYIRGSPFNVKVVSPVEEPWGSHSDIWWLGGPYRGVAFIRAGEIFFFAGDGMSANGTKLRSFGTRGRSGPDSLYILGVWMMKANILVADNSNQHIQVH